MKSKILTGVCLAFVVIASAVIIALFEEDDVSITTEEINELEKQ